MATAVGYWIDQGSPARPRRTQAPMLLSTPFGYFRTGDAREAYRNQEFYVYLLRIGSLTDIRRHIEALAQAEVKDNTRTSETLADYAAALNPADTGSGGDFSSVYAVYVGDRGYLRSPEGWIWLAEPSGAEGGTPFKLDASLFVASHGHPGTTTGATTPPRASSNSPCTAPSPERPAATVRSTTARPTTTSSRRPKRARWGAARAPPAALSRR